MEFYDFPYIGSVIIPTDELIFFRGVGQPPTSYWYEVSKVRPIMKHLSKKITWTFTMWCPIVISWFISPSNYSYKYHKP